MKAQLVYQIAIGPIPAKAQECIDHNRLVCESLGVPYFLSTHRPGLAPTCKYSDWLRLFKACDTDCMIYADWDIKLYGNLDFPEDKALFGRGTEGYLDYFVFWTGKTYPLFARMIQHCARGTPTNLNGGGWDLCQVFAKDVREYPTECFTHLNLKMGHELWRA